MKHLEDDQCFTNTRFNFHRVWGTGFPEPLQGMVTTAVQCARISSPSTTKSHGGTTLGTDHAHRSPSHRANVPWQGLRMPRDHYRVLSVGFVPWDLSQKLFHHWGLSALNPSWGLLRHRDVPEGPFRGHFISASC